jgi:hypothetical protein
MIPWLQSQKSIYPVPETAIEAIVTLPSPELHPRQIGLLMSRKDALAAAQALLQAVANESGLEVKISATPVPEILRCPNKVA